MFDALISLCTSAAALALPQDWWAAWSFAPAVVLPLLAALAWALGAWPHARHLPLTATQRRLRVGGWLLLALALISPLCRLAATLVSAHMVQLMVLTIAAPALLALGAARLIPRNNIAQATGADATSGGALAAATFVHGALIWLWHVPVVYAATLESPLVHWFAYAALCGAAFWFWRSVLHAAPAMRGRALLALVATTAHTGLLGALLTFAQVPLYAGVAAGARAWGLTPLEDQQLAGLIMWVPGSLAYLVAGIALAVHALRPSAPSYGLTPEVRASHALINS